MKFPGVELLETAPKLERERKLIIHQDISRPSRAVTAEKCTKKCNARAELLF